MFSSKSQVTPVSPVDLIATRASMTMLLARARRFLLEEDEYHALLDYVEAYQPSWVTSSGTRRISLKVNANALVVSETVADACLTKYSIPLVLSLRDRCLELAVLIGSTRDMTLVSDITNGE